MANIIKSNSGDAATRMALSKRLARGEIVRVARGLYREADDFGEHESLVSAVYHHPLAVVALLSALQFHNITTALPQQTWIALPPNASRPTSDNIRCVVLSGNSYSYGQETYMIDGIEIKVYSAAKSIVDAFKFRNKIGVSIAIEALNNGLSRRATSIEDVMLAAKACRMYNVIKPYLEMCNACLWIGR